MRSCQRTSSCRHRFGGIGVVRGPASSNSFLCRRHPIRSAPLRTHVLSRGTWLCITYILAPTAAAASLSLAFVLALHGSHPPKGSCCITSNHSTVLFEVAVSAQAYMCGVAAISSYLFAVHYMHPRADCCRRSHVPCPPPGGSGAVRGPGSSSSLLCRRHPSHSAGRGS